MVSRKLECFFATAFWHKSSRVSYIYSENLLINNQTNNRTTTWFIDGFFGQGYFYEFLFCLQTSFPNRFDYVSWKISIRKNEFVQIVFQEIRTATTSMTIINSKVVYFRPNSLKILLWFYINNYWYSVFIVISYQALGWVDSIKNLVS